MLSMMIGIFVVQGEGKKVDSIVHADRSLLALQRLAAYMYLVFNNCAI